jgi:hypothetical protein
MSKINKKNRIKFVNSAVQLILSQGWTENPKKSPEQSSREFIMGGEKNQITLTVWGEDTHELVYSVYGRLKNPVNGKSNGKYNFHTVGPVENAVADLEHYLESIKKYL